jgi:hypothetical protein
MDKAQVTPKAQKRRQVVLVSRLKIGNVKIIKIEFFDVNLMARGIYYLDLKG